MGAFDAVSVMSSEPRKELRTERRTTVDFPVDSLRDLWMCFVTLYFFSTWAVRPLYNINRERYARYMVLVIAYVSVRLALEISLTSALAEYYTRLKGQPREFQVTIEFR